MGRRAAIAVAAAVLVVGCSTGEPREPDSTRTRTAPVTGETSPDTRQPAAELTVTSTAFADGDEIPREFACASKGGRNVPPPLTWDGVPDRAESLALVLDDPDAVGGRYVHWVVTELAAGAGGVSGGEVPAGASVTANSGADAAYLGPCPPDGTGVHHYRFTLYALGESVDLPVATPAEDAEAVIKAAAVDDAVLVGTFGQ